MKTEYRKLENYGFFIEKEEPNLAKLVKESEKYALRGVLEFREAGSQEWLDAYVEDENGNLFEYSNMDGKIVQAAWEVHDSYEYSRMIFGTIEGIISGLTNFKGVVEAMKPYKRKKKKKIKKPELVEEEKPTIELTVTTEIIPEPKEYVDVHIYEPPEPPATLDEKRFAYLYARSQSLKGEELAKVTKRPYIKKEDRAVFAEWLDTVLKYSFAKQYPLEYLEAEKAILEHFNLTEERMNDMRTIVHEVKLPGFIKNKTIKVPKDEAAQMTE